MGTGAGGFWWESEIPRLRVLIEDLDRRLETMGTWGPERARALEEKSVLQFELDNAIRAAESHVRANLMEMCAPVATAGLFFVSTRKSPVSHA